MSRAYNFSAGPGALPEPVLRQAQQEMLEWRDARARGLVSESQTAFLIQRIDRALDTTIARESARVENGLGSLAIVTVLYVLVTLVLTGMVPYTDLAGDSTLTTAFEIRGVTWVGWIINLGAIAGLTTVVMVMLLGQTRVAFAMSRDGLLPRSLAHTGKRGTPARLTVIVGVTSAVLAAIFPMGTLEEMVNIGTLFAFVLVSIGVVVLRRTRPELSRGFKVPLMPVIPILSVLACLWLMLNLSIETWLRFLVWMAIGLVIYFAFGRRNSVFARRERGELASVSGPGEAPEVDLGKGPG